MAWLLCLALAVAAEAASPAGAAHRFTGVAQTEDCTPQEVRVPILNDLRGAGCPADARAAGIAACRPIAVVPGAVPTTWRRAPRQPAPGSQRNPHPVPAADPHLPVQGTHHHVRVMAHRGQQVRCAGARGLQWRPAAEASTTDAPRGVLALQHDPAGSRERPHTPARALPLPAPAAACPRPGTRRPAGGPSPAP